MPRRAAVAAHGATRLVVNHVPPRFDVAPGERAVGTRQTLLTFSVSLVLISPRDLVEVGRAEPAREPEMSRRTRRLRVVFARQRWERTCDGALDTQVRVSRGGERNRRAERERRRASPRAEVRLRSGE